MQKVKNWTILVLTIFVLITAWQLKSMTDKRNTERADKERWRNNYEVRGDSLKIIVGENGILSARIESQNLSIDELKNYYTSLTADIKDMKIQLRKVASATTIGTETTNQINTFFRDSLIQDTIKVEYLSYHSAWLDLDVFKQDNKAIIKSISRDSLLQVIHWNYSGKFWPTKFMTKKVYFQDIKSFNPDSRIKYVQWIELKRKKDLYKK